MKEETKTKIFFAISLFFLIILSIVAHEMTHYWQYGFKGNEICFMGSSNLSEGFYSSAGWYQPGIHGVPERSIFNSDDTEHDALFVQFLFLLSSMGILIYVYLKK